MESVKNGIRTSVTKSVIEFVRLFKNDFQKEGTITAEIKQEVTTTSHYPSKKVDSSLSANLFEAKDFGFAEQAFTSQEKRMAWMPVPANITEEAFKAKLDAAIKNGATIYRVLSCSPILDENQRYAIGQGLKSIDDFGDSQAVRVPNNEQTLANGTAGKLVLDNAGRVQYRRTYFWASPKEDVDMRNEVEPYQTAKIKAELQGASVLEGQTV